MLSCSRVHECIEAQPHPLDPGNCHPGDHSVLLRWADLYAVCSHSQRADPDAHPIRDIHSHRHIHLHPDRHAQPDFDTYRHQYHDGNRQPHSHSDSYPNTDPHIKTNLHPLAHFHTAAHFDTHAYIYPLPASF
jgi:hypothetical protein